VVREDQAFGETLYCREEVGEDAARRSGSGIAALSVGLCRIDRQPVAPRPRSTSTSSVIARAGRKLRRQRAGARPRRERTPTRSADSGAITSLCLPPSARPVRIDRESLPTGC